VITGRCSGALKQEFRELELLDEITQLRHSRKLPLTMIAGDTRNDLMYAFREWKGEQYVPHNVHPCIRWSKNNPWLESEVLSLEERLELLEKLRGKIAAKNEGKKVVPVNDWERGSHLTDEISNKKGESGLSLRLLSLDTSDQGRKVKGNRARRRRSSGLQTLNQGLRRASASQVTSVPAARKQKSKGHFS
jgi:hypothetical protein